MYIHVSKPTLLHPSSPGEKKPTYSKDPPYLNEAPYGSPCKGLRLLGGLEHQPQLLLGVPDAIGVCGVDDLVGCMQLIEGLRRRISMYTCVYAHTVYIYNTYLYISMCTCIYRYVYTQRMRVYMRNTNIYLSTVCVNVYIHIYV